MRTLLLSAVLYLLGVAAVLYIRPLLMFHRDGTWKEFGVENPEQNTIFPFWMFCIVWALGAFGLVSLGEYLFGDDEAPVVAGAVAAAAAARPEPIPLQPLPPRTRHRRRDAGISTSIQTPTGVMQPGYYMLDPVGSGVPGVPRYVYIGPEGPGVPASGAPSIAPVSAAPPIPPEGDFSSDEE